VTAIIRSSKPSDGELAAKRKRMDQNMPGWRDMRYPNGKPVFSADGTMLDEQGGRSVFDDVDE
jgi:hypothetical protein